MTTTDLEGWHPGEVDTDPVHLAYQETQAQVVDRYVQGRLASLGEFGEWLSNCGWGIHHQAWLAAYGVLRLPAELGRLVRDSPRGLGVVVRAWGPWVSGSRQNERIRLAIASQDIERALDAKKRDRIVGGVLTFLFVALVAGGTWVGWHHAPIRTVLAWLGAVLALGVVARMSRGERVLPRPDVPVGRVITSAAVVEACQPICGKDKAVTVIGVPHRDGDLTRVKCQAPHGISVSKFAAGRDIIAQGLKVAEDCLVVDPLPLQSADLFELQISSKHPLELKVGHSPVLEVTETDAHQGIPMGGASSGLTVLSLNRGGVLVSGTSGYGKTVLLRNILNACLLDPAMKPCVWDFKGDGDFAAYEDVIELHEGDDDETVKDFAEWLKWQRNDEMPRRKAAIREAVRAGGSDPKLTRQLALRIGLPFVPVFGDEIQVPLSWGGTTGQEIEDGLLHMARTGRSRGYHLILATQRPDSDAIKTAVRAQLPTRLVTYMDNAASSQMALGTPAEAGWNANALPAVPGYAIGLGPGVITGATKFKAFDSTVDDARRVVRTSLEVGVRSVQSTSVNRPELHLVQDSPRDRPALPEVLRLALAAWPVAGYDAHADILAGCMGWDRGDLVTAMKDLGVPLRAVYMPRTDGENTTQRGFKRDAVDEAKARYAAP